MKIKSLFQYTPPGNYNFTIENVQNIQAESLEANQKNKKVFSSISENYKYIQSVYNALINSDIVLRKFAINVNNQEYDAFIFYIDGMSDSNFINQFILKPLMLNIPTKLDVSTTDYADLLYKRLIPQNNIVKQTEFSKIFSSANSGNCILFVDSIDVAFDFDVKGFKQRSVDKPNIESVIKGPQEAFVENLRTNTSILRRLVNNENLIIENIEIGALSKTKCALCYMQNITNDNLVAEAKFRLNNIEIDSLLSSGELEQLIQDDNISGIPQIISTERPDKCVKALFQGRAIILINENPYALIIPSVLTDFLASPEDSNLNPLFTNFLKFIRFIAFFITLLLPGLYIAITNFHQELFPTELLFSILVARENVPFPIIFELLLMEISFELIREGGLRTPSAIGSTLGIVGALILGDAAVSANIVSPILIIIVAITGLASFVIPNFSFGFHLRVYRFVFIILGYIAGFLGIGIGIYVYMATVFSLKSFGIAYASPISPSGSDIHFKYFIPPFWKQEYRNGFLATKKPKSQNKYSMKWKQNL